MSGEERHAEETRRIADDGTEYDCQAYGPDSRGYCFVELNRPCRSRDECEVTMTRERLILWVRLAAMEQAGDEVARIVLDGVDSPQQLLNADHPPRGFDQA